MGKKVRKAYFYAKNLKILNERRQEDETSE